MGNGFDKLCFQTGHQFPYALASSVYNDMGHFAVERVAVLKKFLQTGFGILRLQQWAVTVMARAQPEILHAGSEIDDRARLSQPGAGQGAQDSPTTSGQDDAATLDQLADHVLFPCPKTGFAFQFKNGRNTYARMGLDFVVGVHEGKLEFLRQGATYSGFTGPHQPHEKKIALHIHSVHCSRLPLIMPEELSSW